MSKGKNNSSNSTSRSASTGRFVKNPAKAVTIQLPQVDRAIKKVAYHKTGSPVNSPKSKA